MSNGRCEKEREKKTANDSTHFIQSLLHFILLRQMPRAVNISILSKWIFVGVSLFFSFENYFCMHQRILVFQWEWFLVRNRRINNGVWVE